MNQDNRRTLFVAHYAALRRFTRLLTSSGEEADDLLQDLAVAVFAHPSGPTDVEAFASWCCGVARHVAMHRRRTWARVRAREDGARRFELEAECDAAVDSVERVAMAKQSLAAHLSGLGPGAVGLLHDRFLLEETSTEIAARLNVSASSVRMRVARLVAGLRKEAIARR